MSDSMSKRLMATEEEACQAEEIQTLDFMLTKIVWERALKSKDDRVYRAMMALWKAVKASEKKSG